MRVARDSESELVRSHFCQNLSKAAHSHRRMGFFYQPVVEALISRIDHPPGEMVVDLGCRSGWMSKGVISHFPDARVVGVEGVVEMLRVARDENFESGRFTPLAALPQQLPLADNSVDLVVSALSICHHSLTSALKEVERVIAPGGQFLAAFVARGTVGELASAWSRVDDCSHIHPFSGLEEVGDALVEAGFVNSVADRAHWKVEYSELETLFSDLRALGETNVLTQRRRTLTGKRRFDRLRSALELSRGSDGKIPISLEVIYAFGQLPPSRPVEFERS